MMMMRMTRSFARTFSSSKAKTGVLMLNMGGPSHPDDTEDFLKRLFQDSDIIELGGGKFQELLGSFISKRRTPKVKKQYETIGGSPIRKWTEYQGKEMCKILDETCPESAPHKAYTAFRYADPLTEDALQEMKEDGVEHAIAFSQFPQWSCTTSGSSMNELWREVRCVRERDLFVSKIVGNNSHPSLALKHTRLQRAFEYENLQHHSGTKIEHDRYLSMECDRSVARSFWVRERGSGAYRRKNE